MVPFWLPGLWIATGLLALPGHPIAVMLGYHALLASGCLGAKPRWGRLDRISRIWLIVGVAALALPFLLPRLSFFPETEAARLLSHWPGGLWGHLPYALLINVPLEEGYWRGVLEARHGTWSPWRHGAAFGLHHAAAAALTLPWAWVLPAFLVTAAIGAFWTWAVRRTGGLGFALLSHALADLLLVLLVARQLG
ncbi:MAG TPA: CPBP family glutamic-type intramembrane protease [Holophagaceae bacterium]|nr:CPBP family glutamic-type intramembrane protease [Holophagaceae bacterium]